VDVLTRKGDGHYLVKQYRAAANAYRQASLKANKSEQGEYCGYQLGQALYRLQSYGEAVTAMKSFVSNYRSSKLRDDAMFSVGWIHFQQKQYLKAIQEYNNFLERFPESPLAPRAQYSIGDAYYNLGDFENAATAYRTAIEKYPGSPFTMEAFTSLQQTLLILGREEEALELSDKIGKASSNSPIARELPFKQADFFQSLGKYDDAASEYRAYLEKFPNGERSAEALFLLARVQAQSDSLTEALEILNQTEEQYPNSEFAHKASLEKGLLFLDRDSTTKAEELLQQTEEKYPNTPSAIRAGFERAYLAEQNGDTAVAIQRYRNLADTYSSTEYGDRSRFRIGMYYRFIKQNDSARAEFAKITSRQDGLGAEAQYRIGELWMVDTNYTEAITAFSINKNRFSDFEDWYSMSLLGLGEAYLQTNNFPAAEEHFRLVRTLRADDEFGANAIKKLEELQEREKTFLQLQEIQEVVPESLPSDSIKSTDSASQDTAKTSDKPETQKTPDKPNE
jgi:TolA-binding protein